MSSAFIKEGEYRKLSDIDPTISSLLVYLTQENSGLRIREKKSYYSKELETEVFEMTDGLEYHKKDGYWKVIL